MFGTELREVDSAMAATLAHLLGPASVSLCYVVPLPPRKTSPPDGEGELIAINAEIDVDEEPASADPDHGPQVNDGAPVLDPYLWTEEDDNAQDEPPLSEWEIAVNAHIEKAIEKAKKEDPRWEEVTTDLRMALAGDSDAHRRILPMVQAAQLKRKVYCTTLETYVLQRWSQPRLKQKSSYSPVKDRPQTTSNHSPSHGHGLQ